MPNAPLPPEWGPIVVIGTPLAGQVALVTRGGRGIGRAIARRLALAGADVAVLARSLPQMDAIAEEAKVAGSRILALTADVSDRHAVRAGVELVHAELGRIDLLVSNAGVNTVFGPVWEVDGDAWWRDVTINLRGCFESAAAVLPEMVERGAGRVVNVASGAAGQPFPFNSSYAASKAAVVRFTDCLAAETQPYGVSVFALGPGSVETDMTRGLLMDGAGQRWMADVARSLQFVSPELPGWAAVFLATGRADGLTGRWLDSSDDLAAVAAASDRIGAQDIFQLRRTKL